MGGVLAQRLANLGGAWRAHFARGLMKTQARCLEGKIAYFEQFADGLLGIGNQRRMFVLVDAGRMQASKMARGTVEVAPERWTAPPGTGPRVSRDMYGSKATKG